MPDGWGPLCWCVCGRAGVESSGCLPHGTAPVDCLLPNSGHWMQACRIAAVLTPPCISTRHASGSCSWCHCCQCHWRQCHQMHPYGQYMPAAELMQRVHVFKSPQRCMAATTIDSHSFGCAHSPVTASGARCQAGWAMHNCLAITLGCSVTWQHGSVCVAAFHKVM